MQKRVGLILVISGLVLLIKPNFDFSQFMMNVNYLVAHYWPVGFILIGLVMLWPQKPTPTRRKSRT